MNANVPTALSHFIGLIATTPSVFPIEREAIHRMNLYALLSLRRFFIFPNTVPKKCDLSALQEIQIYIM